MGGSPTPTGHAARSVVWATCTEWRSAADTRGDDTAFLVFGAAHWRVSQSLERFGLKRVAGATQAVRDSDAASLCPQWRSP